MAKKTAEQRADEIARKTYYDVCQGPDACTVEHLLALSRQQHISVLRGFGRVPRNISYIDFASMIQDVLQKILDKQFGTNALRVHVRVEYVEPPYVGLFDMSPGMYVTGWHVTRV